MISEYPISRVAGNRFRQSAEYICSHTVARLHLVFVTWPSPGSIFSYLQGIYTDRKCGFCVWQCKSSHCHLSDDIADSLYMNIARATVII